MKKNFVQDEVTYETSMKAEGDKIDIAIFSASKCLYQVTFSKSLLTAEEKTQEEMMDIFIEDFKRLKREFA